MNRIVIVLIFLFFSYSFADDENNSANVDKLVHEGIVLMNKGNFNKAVKIFDQAIAADPDNIKYQYEKALCYYKLKDYDKTIAVLTPLKNNTKVFENIYQILGNTYDFKGNKDSAIAIYNEGLKKFPNSGRLYLELGVTEFGMENNGEAVGYWERGIQVDPMYDMNYYRLVKYLMETSERIWPAIYAEIFLNLTGDLRKYEEISADLYDLYTDALFSFQNGKRKIGFTDIIKKTKNKSLYSEQPFPMVVNKIYKETARRLKDTTKNASINEIMKFRTAFIRNWKEKNLPKIMPNVLFDYLIKIDENDLSEQYNYWIFQFGNDKEFQKWIVNNKTPYHKFHGWRTKNLIRIDSSNYFSKSKVE